MKKTILSAAIIILLVSPVYAGEIIGMYQFAKDRGFVKVKAIAGYMMSFDAAFVSVNGQLVILTDVYADYDPKRNSAVYSEDRLCPDALRMSFQDNGKVVLREAACSCF